MINDGPGISNFSNLQTARLQVFLGDHGAFWNFNWNISQFYYQRLTDD